MLRRTIIFFIIAMIAAVFGFTGVAERAADVSRILFFIFLILIVILFFLGQIHLKEKIKHL